MSELFESVLGGAGWGPGIGVALGAFPVAEGRRGRAIRPLRRRVAWREPAVAGPVRRTRSPARAP